MSQPISSTTSPLSYSREFLLQYQHIKRPDPAITSRLTPVLTPPLNPTKKTRNYHSPYHGTNSKPKVSNKKTHEILSTYKVSFDSLSKTDKQSFTDPISWILRETKQGIGPVQNSTFCRSSNNVQYCEQDTIKPIMSCVHDLSPTSLDLVSPFTPCSPSDLSSGLNALSIDEDSVLSMPSPIKPPVYFCGSKFAALFSQSEIQDVGNDVSRERLYLEELTPFAFNDLLSSPPCNISPQTYTVTPPKPSSTNLKSWPLHETPQQSSRNQTPVTTPSKVSTPFRSSKTPHKPSHTNRPISPLDDQRLIQRQKQIDYGYRTVGYLRYRLLVPKEKRKPEHPRTPKKTQGCSKRSWDGQLKKWRRDLHMWDPDNIEAFRVLLSSTFVETIITANPELADIVCVVREKLDNPVYKDDGNFDFDSDDKEFSLSSETLNFAMNHTDNKNKISGDSKLDKVARTLVF